MRSRIAGSGSAPTPAFILSTRCWGWLVAGITQGTAGWARIHFRKNWAQLPQSNSAAPDGSGRPRTPPNRPPSQKGRVPSPARPPSRASGRPDLGGEKECVEDPKLRPEVAHHAFGRPVHWRRIDHTPAQLEKALQDFPERLARSR